MKSKIYGYSFALFTIMMWSLNLIYAKYLSAILTPSEISFYRWIIGFFVMLPFAWKEIIKYREFLWKNCHIILFLALSGIGFQNWFIYKAGETADATTMSLISITGPIFLIAMSKQKINFTTIIGILFAIFGVIDLILRGNFKNIYSFQLVDGDIYMLGSALMFAVYAIVQKNTPKNIPESAVLTTAIGTAALIYFFPSLPELCTLHLKHIPKLTMLIIIILGIFNSAIAYLSWDSAIKLLGAVSAGTTYYTLPVFAIIFAHLILGEKIYASQIFGAIMIFIGVILVIFGKQKNS